MSARRCREPSEKKLRFWQFDLRQLLMLFAVLGLLFGIVAPWIRKTFDDRRLQNDLFGEQQIQWDLHMAVDQGYASLARRSLEAGANPNLVFDGEKDLLCMSIENGRIDIMEILLDHGADIEKNSPLLVAIESDQPANVRLKMVRCLLQHGADPHRERGSKSAMNSAVRAGDAEVGDLLRESGVEYGPREMAAFNRLEELQHVVEKNPSVVRDRFEPVYASRPGHGPTLLGIALYGGYREMAIYLIDHDAPLDTIEGTGSTLLHRACRGGDPELIRLLVARGLDVNARDDYKDTPLTDSVWNTRAEAIDVLIEAGADLNARGINEATALHLAAGHGRVDVVSKLLAAGADPTIVNIHGEVPLDVARERTKRLLEAETSPALRERSKEKDIRLARKKYAEIEKLLLGTDKNLQFRPND